jgi:hypothetical protein
MGGRGEVVGLWQTVGWSRGEEEKNQGNEGQAQTVRDFSLTAAPKVESKVPDKTRIGGVEG